MKQGSGQTQDKSFLKNKISQIISLAFVVDYPSRWSSFFSDLLQTLNMGSLAVNMFLRVLLAIDSDVVDRDIVHTPQVQYTTVLDNNFFQRKIVNIFLPICFNMCFGFSKEPSHWDGSFEYPQHMFWKINKKINLLLRTLN